MKDYLSYTLMNDFGVDALLCSYVDITVNGEDWGLYLAVEAIEESFLKRNYGSNYGEVYKPDSMTSSVNSPIDTPVSGDMSDRTMISWIFDNKEYTEMYHELFSEFISSNRFSEIITDTANLIDPYVEKDPTKFCTYDEYQKGVTAINAFCQLRSESIKGQLDGTIPSTTDGQSANSFALIDTSSLTISDMSTMGDGGFGGGPGGNPFDKTGGEKNDDTSSASIKNTSNMQSPNGEGMPDFGGEPPEGFDPSKMIGKEFPEGFDGEAPDEFKANGNTDGNNNTSSSNYQNSNTNETISTDNFPSNRPSMNGFPTMNENAAAKNNNVSYILIGVSVLILFSGIGFALRFKR